MITRSRYFMAAAAGLWMTLPLSAQEPNMLPAPGSIEQVVAGQEQAPMPNRIPTAPVTAGPAFSGEPIPIYQTPMPGPYDLNPPRMPPYAWPTYAPYNN